MYNLKYVVNVGYYQFTFNEADEAVTFAITAKLKGDDKSDDVSIDFIEVEAEDEILKAATQIYCKQMENEYAIRKSNYEEAAQSSETKK